MLLQWCFVLLVFQLNIYVNHGQSCLLQSYISNGLRCPRLSITLRSIFNKYTIIHYQRHLDPRSLVCQVFFLFSNIIHITLFLPNLVLSNSKLFILKLQQESSTCKTCGYFIQTSFRC